MINSLTHPETWLDWLLIYTSIGCLGLLFCLFQTLRIRDSFFTGNISALLGHKKSYLELIENAIIYLVAGLCILFGWPGFLVWLYVEKQRETANLIQQNLPNFDCAPQFLIQKTTIDLAESNSFIYDPLGYTPQVPFGNLNRAWKLFIDKMSGEDSLWSFEIPPRSEIGKYKIVTDGITRGYAIIRNEEISEELIFESGR